MGTKRSKVAVILILCAYFVLIFNTAFSISGTALQDPDSCWLLAMGRRIFVTKEIPQADPFSHTLSPKRDGGGSLNLPDFVPYQWLSEVVLYSVYRGYESFVVGSDDSITKDLNFADLIKKRLSKYLPASGADTANFGPPDPAAVSLLALASLVIVFAFLGIPFWLTAGARENPLLALLLVWVSTWSASFHFYVRPEIFSYLFLAIHLALVNSIRLKGRGQSGGSGEFKAFIPELVALTLLSILWSNFHSGFVCGILFLGVIFVMELSKLVLVSEKNPLVLKAVVLSLALSVSGSFVTPFGVRLFQYLPHLFFDKTNTLIEELRPLTVPEILSSSYLPYLLFSVLSILAVSYCGRAADRRVLGHIVMNGLVIVAAIAVGYSCRRLIPFTSLFILFETLFVFALTAREVAGLIPLRDPDSIAAAMAPLYKNRRNWLSLGGTACVVLLSSFMVGKAFLPSIPQVNYAFAAPFDALAFIQKSKFTGNLFNDPQYGDLMVWHLYPSPPVFIDTRFDAYGSEVVFDTFKIENASAGWQKLLERHEIKWVFVPANSMLAHKLKDSADWHQEFRDNIAVVYSKKPKERAE